MKTHRSVLPLIAVGAGIAAVLALAWFISEDGPAPASVAGALTNGSSERSVPERPETRPGQPDLAAESIVAPMPASTRMAAPPAGVDPFAPALSDAELLRTERRMFQAQTWEVDLGKALDLRPGERLERRSGLFRLSGGGELVRLDRVYRLGAARPAAMAKAATQTAQSPAVLAAAAAGATGPLDAGGGELVWANAMVADHLMVQVESGVTRERLAAALPRQAKVGKQVTDRGLYLVEVPADGERSVERAVLALNQIKGVIKFAEPDFVLTSTDTASNDPLFTANAADLTKQWHLAKIRAPRAWDVLTGPPFPPAHPQYQPRLDQTVVAIVDTGIDFTHPDLVSRMWTNPGETGGGKETNNADDDGNGKIDDWQGWDFIDNDKNPMDDVGHGTHVAGIIGAVGNNATGGSGVCWNVKLLNLRIIKAQGTGTYGTYSAAIAALDYIRVLNTTGRKVAVANHSWGGNGYSLAMLNAVNNPLATADPLPTGITSTFVIDVNTLTVAGTAGEIAKIKVGMSISGAGIPAGTLVTIVSGSTITLSDYTMVAATGAVLTFSNPSRAKPYGVVHVAAAGNSRFNCDRIPVYPACLPSGFMVSVGATDSTDTEALWSGGAGSNFGRLNVDVFAPGSGIWSTKWKAPGDAAYGYETRNGTSMAAPQMAGALALVRMWQPNLTEQQARQVVIEQADSVPTLQHKCVSGGRLNIAKIIDRLYQPVLVGSGGATGGSGDSGSPLSGPHAISGIISAGESATLALRNGKVVAWGWNYYGQLGSATEAEQLAVPIEVPGLDDVVMVVAAWNSSYALKADGTVWGWGNARLLGGATGGSIPAQIPNLTDVTWLSSIFDHTLAVRGDGTVWAWGANDKGQLGDGTTTERLVPVQVTGLDNIVMAEAGSSHSIALKSDGSVYCWGERTSGATATANALGDGALLGQSNVPIQVPGLTGCIQVDAGNGVSLAVKADGTVWQWGRYLGGFQAVLPTQRAELSGITFAILSQSSAFATNGDGKVYGWGGGFDGNMGNGSYDSPQVATEIPIQGGESIVSVAANTKNTYFLTADGNLFASGSNDLGRLGIGTTSTKYYPVQLRGLAAIQHVAYGASPSGWAGYAIDSGGKVFQWGVSNAFTQVDLPTETTFLSGALNIRLHANNGFFTKANGTFWAWGSNTFGELANGTKEPDLTPQQINLGGTAVSFSSGAVTTDSLTGRHVAAVLSTGVIKTWGSNTFGELGDGTTVEHLTPTTVQGITTAVEVATGGVHTIARMADGSVWAWGNNHQGQLGDGSTAASPLPIQIPNLSGVIAIAAVDHSSFALTSDGKLWAWGKNGIWPGLGFAGPVQTLVPTQVPGLPAISRISVVLNAVVLLAQDGTVWAWSDHLARAGRGSTSLVPATIPAPVVGLSGVVEVVAGDACFARKADGTVWAWGGGIGRTLGDGEGQTNLPVAVVGFGGTATTLSTLGTQEEADSWYFQNFSVPELLNNSLVGDTASPAGDGIPNLVKYALGLNPKQRYDASSLPTTRVDLIGGAAQSTGADGGIGLFSALTVDLTNGKRYLAFTVPRNGIHLDVDYFVEVSSDLQNWLSGDPFTITVLDTAETLEVYDATAIEDATKRFMRLRIQRK